MAATKLEQTSANDPESQDTNKAVRRAQTSPLDAASDGASESRKIKRQLTISLDPGLPDTEKKKALTRAQTSPLDAEDSGTKAGEDAENRARMRKKRRSTVQFKAVEEPAEPEEASEEVLETPPVAVAPAKSPLSQAPAAAAAEPAPEPVAEAPGAQRRVLDFWHFVTRFCFLTTLFSTKFVLILSVFDTGQEDNRSFIWIAEDRVTCNQSRRCQDVSRIEKGYPRIEK